MQSDVEAAVDPQRVGSGDRDGARGDSLMPGVHLDHEIQRAVQQCGRDECDDLSVHVEITAPIKYGEDVPRAGLPEVISNTATQRSCLSQRACLHGRVPALPRSRVAVVSLVAASDTASTIP